MRAFTVMERLTTPARDTRTFSSKKIDEREERVGRKLRICEGYITRVAKCLYISRESRNYGKRNLCKKFHVKKKRNKFIVIKRGLFLRRVRNMDNVYIYIQTSLAMRRTYDPSQFQQRSKRIIKRSSQSLFSSHPRSRISSLSQRSRPIHRDTYPKNTNKLPSFRDDVLSSCHRACPSAYSHAIVPKHE